MTSRTPPKTIAGGNIPAKPRGTAIIELAITNTKKCASPNQVLAASTETERTRQRSTAFEIAVNVRLPSATAKIAARERIQFRNDHAKKIPITRVRKISAALPGEGLVGGDAALARTNAAQAPKVAAAAIATRNRLSPSGERGRDFGLGPCANPSRVSV